MYQNMGKFTPIPCTPSFFTQASCVSFSNYEGVLILTLRISSDRDGRHRSVCRFLLAFFWLTGILCGISWVTFTENTLAVLLHRLPYRPVSLGPALLSTLLPFAISALAVKGFGFAALFPVVFTEAFLLTAISFGLIQAYGPSGWLISGILLLGNWFCEPLLYLMWLRDILYFGNASTLERVLFLCLAFWAECIFICIISPYLACLIII